MGAEWTVGHNFSPETLRVPTPPLQKPADLRTEMAIWYLETRPPGDDRAVELSPQQRNEFLRDLRALGYLQ